MDQSAASTAAGESTEALATLTEAMALSASASMAAQARPERAAPRQLSPGTAFLLLGSITVSFLAGSMAPTPLYPIYQQQWGLSAVAITAIFGIYALALLGSLLVAGRLSDHLGRRPVLFAATTVQLLAMGVFASAGSLGPLLLARVIQGLATGAALGAVGAGLLDLSRIRGPVANAVAPPIGTASGGLLTALIVHRLPAPTVMVYALLAAIFALQLLGLLFIAETATPRAGAWRSLVPKIGLPAAARRPMGQAAPVLVAAWSLAGFYGALGPAVVRAVFGLDPSVVSGLVGFTLAGCGAATVLALHRTPPARVMRVGVLALLLGALGLVAALSLHHAVAFFVATAVAGIGFGAGFHGAVRSLVPLVRPEERAGTLSVIFVVSYLAMGLPALLAGYGVTLGAPVLAAAIAFALAVAALAAWAWAGMRRHGGI